MDSEVKESFTRAILELVPTIRKLSTKNLVQRTAWTKKSENTWVGMPQFTPDLRIAFFLARDEIEKVGADFLQKFFSRYPEYGEGKLVGCAGLGSEQLSFNRSGILNKALNYLWNKHGNFDFEDKSVKEIADDLERFVDGNKIPLIYEAVLLNFRMGATSLKLCADLAIRQMTEREISLGNDSPMTEYGISEFVLAGFAEGTKTFGGSPTPLVSPFTHAMSAVEKSMLALRTFKSGAVGFGSLVFRHAQFCPLDHPIYGIPHAHTPAGVYSLTEDELPSLQEHAKLVFDLHEPAMDKACARLSDAERRDRFEDQILDAVVGMEALLLAGLDKEDRRGELKYRFSMNYSTLFKSPIDRRAAYKRAKDLYNYRSTIAHGGEIPLTGIRVGNEKLTLGETARKAKDTLRDLIRIFLPQTKAAPPYKKPEFWENGYFGLSDSGAQASE